MLSLPEKDVKQVWYPVCLVDDDLCGSIGKKCQHCPNPRAKQRNNLGKRKNICVD